MGGRKAPEPEAASGPPLVVAVAGGGVDGEEEEGVPVLFDGRLWLGLGWANTVPITGDGAAGGTELAALFPAPMGELPRFCCPGLRSPGAPKREPEDCGRAGAVVSDVVELPVGDPTNADRPGPPCAGESGLTVTRFWPNTAAYDPGGGAAGWGTD